MKSDIDMLSAYLGKDLSSRQFYVILDELHDLKYTVKFGDEITVYAEDDTVAKKEDIIFIVDSHHKKLGRPRLGKELRTRMLSVRLEPEMYTAWKHYIENNNFTEHVKSMSVAVYMALDHTMRTDGLSVYIDAFKNSTPMPDYKSKK
jgi:hypothetical protein